MKTEVKVLVTNFGEFRELYEDFREKEKAYKEAFDKLATFDFKVNVEMVKEKENG